MKRVTLYSMIAGVVVALVLGSTAAYAYWTATANATGTTSSTSVAVSVSPVADTTILNTLSQQPTSPQTMTGLATVTVTNTGATAGTVNLSMAADGTFATRLPTYVWEVTATAPCAQSSTSGALPAQAGTWASTTLATSVSLAAGASKTYCVRTSPQVATRNSQLSSPTGTQSVTATVTATLTGTGWNPVTATASALAKTDAIFQLSGVPSTTADAHWYKFAPVVNGAASTTSCLDITSHGGAGAQVITYQCGYPQGNEAFQLTTVSGIDSLVQIRPLHAPTTAVATVTAGIRLANVSGSDTSQQWYMQVRDASKNIYQFVSASTGKCLGFTNVTSGSSNVVAQDCNVATSAVALVPVPITVSGNGTNPTINVGFNVSGETMPIVEYRSGSSWAGCNFQLFGTNGQITSGSSISCSYVTSSNAGAMRITVGGTVIAQFTVRRAAGIGGAWSISGTVTP